MRVPVHHHFNLRQIAVLELHEETVARLNKPEPLPALYEQVGTGPDGRPLMRVKPRNTPHIVETVTEAGLLRLFPVTGNGSRFIVTDTPDVALRLALPPPE